MNNPKNQLIDQLAPFLKEKGYKKRRQTWNLFQDKLVVIFDIQNSQWDSNDYYLNCGIVIKDLHPSQKFYSVSSCDITERIPTKNQNGVILSVEQIISILELWENWYGTIQSLRKKALENKLPRMASSQAITYLTTVCFR